MASEIPLPFWNDGNTYQPPFQGILDGSFKPFFSDTTLLIITTLILQILQQENEKQSCKLPKLLAQTLLANIDKEA